MKRRRNTKRVVITIDNSEILRILNRTSTFRNLSRLQLKVGDNYETVNHYQYSEMLRMYPIIGVKIREVTPITETITKLSKYESNDTFLYKLLSRLQDDCDYYLGSGNRSARSLWALDERAHIDEMKAIYNYLEVKPEWLTMRDIEEYEKQMV